ncbi:hypothetical protein BDV18DRAFT_157007 [Aspergillus unguis]
MGNCHSSQDTHQTAPRPAQRRSIGSASKFRSLKSQPYQAQNASSSTSGAGVDIWSPPPYTSTTSTTKTTTATATGTTPNDTAYSFLSTFDTLFLVDDSTSMRGERWREAEDAIAAIAPICTHYDSDGIDIYFLNHRNPSSGGGTGTGTGPGPGSARTGGGYKNVTDAMGVREIFKSVYASGATPVGTRLHQILSPYLRDLARLTAQGREAELKPLNIIVITDGVFTDDAETVIINVARQLDHPSVQAAPWQVGIQFFQVGDDEPAKEYLQALDDELVRRQSCDGIRDIVDTVPWRGDRGRVLNAEGILKCVLGAVNKRFDKAEASR